MAPTISRASNATDVRTQLLKPCIALALATGPAFADPPATASAPSTNSTWSLDTGPALLARIVDFTFNFDESGFYWLVRRIQSHDKSSVFVIRAQDKPTPWRYLMERPSEYRGKLVLIEGYVQSSQAYTLHPPGEPEIGPVLQSELSDPITHALCTIITVGATQPLPLRTRVQTKAYFLKTRRYKTRAADVADAPLLVAHHLDVIAPPASSRDFWDSRGGLFSRQNLILLATGGMAITWLIVRRITQRPLPTRRLPRTHRRQQEDQTW